MQIAKVPGGAGQIIEILADIWGVGDQFLLNGQGR